MYRTRLFEEEPESGLLDPCQFQIATIGQPATEHLVYNPRTTSWDSFKTREDVLLALAYQNEDAGAFLGF